MNPYRLLAVTRREFLALYCTPVGWAVAVLFLFVNGVSFVGRFVHSALAEVGPLFTTNLYLLVLLGPLMSMRLLAEEYRVGTVEAALSSPLRESEWVLGKLLGALLFWATLLAFTLVYPVVVYYFSAGGIDWGAVFVFYVGLFLLGGFYLAVGLFTSSLSDSQLLAALGAFVICLTTVLAGPAVERLAGAGIAPEPSRLLLHLSLSHHQADFAAGVLNTADVVYLVSGSAFFAYLAVRVVGARRLR